MQRGQERGQHRADAVEQMLAEGYAPSLVDHEVLVNCYVRSSNMKGAEQLFEAIRRKGMKPTVWTYNSLLTGYKRNGSWERALQIYQIMKLDQVQPDGVTYMILLDLLGRAQKQEYMPVLVKDLQQGDDLVGNLSREINAAFPNHLMGDVNLYNSAAFLQNFEQLLQNESVELLNYQFSKLYLRQGWSQRAALLVHPPGRPPCRAVPVPLHAPLAPHRARRPHLQAAVPLLRREAGRRVLPHHHERRRLAGLHLHRRHRQRASRVVLAGAQRVQVLLVHGGVGEGRGTGPPLHRLFAHSGLPNAALPRAAVEVLRGVDLLRAVQHILARRGGVLNNTSCLTSCGTTERRSWRTWCTTM